MWVIIKVDNREMIHVADIDTKEEAYEVIYNDLLKLYDGDVNKMNEDIKFGEAGIFDSELFAWSNRRGKYDIQAFWV